MARKHARARARLHDKRTAEHTRKVLRRREIRRQRAVLHQTVPSPGQSPDLSEATVGSRRVGDEGEHAEAGTRALEADGVARYSHDHLCGGGDPTVNPVLCVACARIGLPHLMAELAAEGWHLVPSDWGDQAVLEALHLGLALTLELESDGPFPVVTTPAAGTADPGRAKPEGEASRGRGGSAGPAAA